MTLVDHLRDRGYPEDRGSAKCPRCGAKACVFIRSDDGTDLVCLSKFCREVSTPASSSRQAGSAS
jgi:hypothetical protein